MTPGALPKKRARLTSNGQLRLATRQSVRHSLSKPKVLACRIDDHENIRCRRSGQRSPERGGEIRRVRSRGRRCGRRWAPATDGGQGRQEEQDNQGNAERASHGFPYRLRDYGVRSLQDKIRVRRVFRSGAGGRVFRRALLRFLALTEGRFAYFALPAAALVVRSSLA